MFSLGEAVKVFENLDVENGIFWCTESGWHFLPADMWDITPFWERCFERILEKDPDAMVVEWQGSADETERFIDKNYGDEDYSLSGILAELEEEEAED
jgi:hypothetical protein